MATRSRALQNLQVGKESTAGTAVAASKILRAVRPSGPEAVIPVDVLVGTGMLANASSVLGRAHGRIDVEGSLSYGDLLYFLASHYKSPATTGAGPYTHTFTPAVGAANTIDTLTVEVGDATIAERIAYGFTQEFRIQADETRVAFNASMIGRTPLEGHTLTGSPTEIQRIIAGPREWKFEVAAESGSPSWSEVCLTSAEFTSSGARSPFFCSDSAQTSFTDTVEMAPQIGMNITLERKAATATILEYKGEPHTTRMCRLKFTSATTPHDLEIQMCYRITGDPSRTEIQGVEGVTIPLTCFYGATAGFFVKTVLINSLATL